MPFQDTNAGWLLLFVVVIELMVVFLVATPERAASARASEIRSAPAFLGKERAKRSQRFADAYFRKHFIDTGLVQQSRAMFIPTEENKQRATGLENFVPGVFSSFSRRLEGFWAMVHMAYRRAYIATFLFFVGLSILIPALIDALVSRRQSLEAHGVTNAVFFHSSKRLLVVLTALVPLLLIVPFAVDPIVWIAWSLFTPIACWVTIRNVQELQ